MICLSSPDIYTEDKAIAKAIAGAFKTQTLIELSDHIDGFDYLLIDENGNDKLVKIIESETGVKILN